MTDWGDAYERALGLIGAALDEQPGQAFRAMMTPQPEPGQLIEVLWASASISALLLDTWAQGHPEVGARDILQAIIASERWPKPTE